jgi:Ser/Thr protein kinase RdoA (MazF antagonist)
VIEEPEPSKAARQRAVDAEELLVGGNVHAAVTRVGTTVRRPTGTWTPAVHALLRHLEDVGFDAAPRVLGIDEQGREILTYAPGIAMGLSTTDPLATDENLSRVAALMAQLHRAVATFESPPGARWHDFAVDPRGGPTVLHNDFAPWNIVIDADDWTIIDWDMAAPGQLDWEIAYGLHTCIPLWSDSGRSDREIVHRLRVFADGYGLNHRVLIESLELVPQRCRTTGQRIQQRAAAQDAAFIRMVEEGHDRNWLAAADHSQALLQTWTAMLTP